MGLQGCLRFIYFAIRRGREIVDCEGVDPWTLRYVKITHMSQVFNEDQ